MSNMVVQTNVLALNSHRYMKQVGQAQSKASARLSSGYKINSAADDAAGLAISEKMRAQIRGLDQASKNSQDAISLIQTAEGGMQEIDNMLQRIRELVVSVSNDTNENNTEGTGDRQKIQDEIDQLVAEIDSMSERVEFNKKKVINGSYADTALQLKNAKAEYDRSSLSKVETNAKLSAYKDALGVTGDTANANGTTAYSRLNAAQDAVDAGVTPYKDALKAYTAAEVTYTEARSTYQTTRQTMEDQLSKANLEASDITDAMLDKTNTAYLGDDFARAFTAYQEASNNWGIEELGFVTKNATTGALSSSITAANALTGKAFTGATSEDDVVLTDVRADYKAYADALEAAKADPSAAAYLTVDPDGSKAAAYSEAKAALQADATYSANAGSITGTMIANDDAFAAKLASYVSAAQAYGIDDLNLASEPYFTEAGLSDAIKGLSVNTTAVGNAAALQPDSAANMGALVGAIEDYNTAGGAAKKTEYTNALGALNTIINTFELGKTADDFTVATITAAITNANAQSVYNAINRYITAADSWGAVGATDATALAGNLSTILTDINTKLSLTGADQLAWTKTLPASTITASAAAHYADITTYSVAGQADANITAATGSVIKAYNDYAAATTALTGAGFNTTTTNANVAADPVLEKALQNYVTAANAWGQDDLDLKNTGVNALDFTAVNVADKYKYDTTTLSNVPAPGSAAQAYNNAGAAAQALINTVASTKIALDANGEYAKFQITKETFATAEAEYKDLVAKRDTAQETVNTLTSNVESSEKEKTRTDTLYNVANAKLDTAKNAVEADDSQALYFQVGANAMQGLEMSIGSVKSDVLGIGDGKGVTNIDVVKDTGLDTTALLDVLDTALSYVTTERSRLGAAQNRLEYTIKSLDISSENLSAAESRIRDTDMAKEMMELTKANTLQQASISMLAQANQAPQSVLQLLG